MCLASWTSIFGNLSVAVEVSMMLKARAREWWTQARSRFGPHQILQKSDNEDDSMPREMLQEEIAND
jgi:hypothetical protein